MVEIICPDKYGRRVDHRVGSSDHSDFFELNVQNVKAVLVIIYENKSLVV